MTRHVFLWLAMCLCVLAACKKPQTELSPEVKKRLADEAAKRAKLTTIPAKEQLMKKPAIKGKAIYFEDVLGTWGKENSFFGSSGGYAAISNRLTYDLDKPGTVILKPSSMCTSERAGSYGGVPAYAEQCDILLIDPSIPAIVYRARLRAKVEDTATLSKSTTRVDARVSAPQIYEFIGGLAQN